DGDAAHEQRVDPDAGREAAAHAAEPAVLTLYAEATEPAEETRFAGSGCGCCAGGRRCLRLERGRLGRGLLGGGGADGRGRVSRLLGSLVGRWGCGGASGHDSIVARGAGGVLSGDALIVL